jgi:RES domain-containing protein
VPPRSATISITWRSAATPDGIAQVAAPRAADPGPPTFRFEGLGYRGHDPSWAFAPTSGQGAAIRGGRFNPAGAPALYLSLAVETVFKEVSAGLARRFDPLTVCAYEVDCDGLVDLSTDEARAAAGVRLEDMAAPWMLDRAEGRRPASWLVHDRLRAAGAAGVVVPSFANGARPEELNLVLWTWGDTPPSRSGSLTRTGGSRRIGAPGSSRPLGRMVLSRSRTAAP